jgi:hypothetical protein
VTDTNDIACVREVTEDEEIEFLLDPSKKRTKKDRLLSELQEHITSCDSKLRAFYEETFSQRYTTTFSTKKTSSL